VSWHRLCPLLGRTGAWWGELLPRTRCGRPRTCHRGAACTPRPCFGDPPTGTGGGWENLRTDCGAAGCALRQTLSTDPPSPPSPLPGSGRDRRRPATPRLLDLAPAVAPPRLPSSRGHVPSLSGARGSHPVTVIAVRLLSIPTGADSTDIMPGQPLGSESGPAQRDKTDGPRVDGVSSGRSHSAVNTVSPRTTVRRHRGGLAPSLSAGSP